MLLPANYLHLLINFVEKHYGIDISHQLKLDGKLWLDRPADFVTDETSNHIYQLAMEKTRDPVLGLKFGASLKFTHLGPLGAAMISSEKIWNMFELIIQFESIRFPGAVTLFQGEEISSVEFIYPAPFNSMPFFHFQCFISGMIQTMESAAGFLDKEISIEFPLLEPENIELYREFLPVNLAFEKKHFSIKIPNCYMQKKLSTYDEVSNKMFVDICKAVQGKISKEKKLPDIVEGLLETYDWKLTLAQTALSLGYSERTLRNKLSKEKTSFRKIINDNRIHRSKALLENTQMTIESIAIELGYSDPANFNRAFKRTTGLAPSLYRSGKGSATISHPFSVT